MIVTPPPSLLPLIMNDHGNLITENQMMSSILILDLGDDESFGSDLRMCCCVQAELVVVPKSTIKRTCKKIHLWAYDKPPTLWMGEYGDKEGI